MRIITDNGSNMIKAMKELSKYATSENSERQPLSSYGEPGKSGIDTKEHDDDKFTDQSDSESDLEPTEMDLTAVEQTFSFMRMPCMAHCIQLVVRSLDQVPQFEFAMRNARSVVNSIRVSSVATQKLISIAGKTVVSDCPTRWSSSYNLLCRLLELKSSINQVFEEMNWDSLALSQWNKLEEICDILRPFALHTDQVQTYVLAMPYLIPTNRDNP